MAQIFISVSASVDLPLPNGFPTVTFSNVDAGEYQICLVSAFGNTVAALDVSVVEPTVDLAINDTQEEVTNG